LPSIIGAFGAACRRTSNDSVAGRRGAAPLPSISRDHVVNHALPTVVQEKIVTRLTVVRAHVFRRDEVAHPVGLHAGFLLGKPGDCRGGFRQYRMTQTEAEQAADQ
jgi:hypothetical protein